MSLALPSLVSQIHRIATRQPVLTLLDGSRASLSASGLAVYALGRERASEAAWLRQTPLPAALAASGAPLDWKTKGYYLAIQWRNLLSKAFFRRPNAPTDPWTAELQAVAHQAWRAALPVVQRYDVVLATLISQAAQQRADYPDRLLDNPFWSGIDEPDDELRFDAHASYLLSLRRTPDSPHDGFCERLSRWFNHQLASALRARDTQDFGLCLMRDHRAADRCPTCPEVSADRPYVGVFDGDKLFERRKPWPITPVTFRGFSTDAPLPEGPEAPALLGLRWLLESRSRLDGIARFTLSSGQPGRLINLRILAKRWKTLRLKTALDAYDVSTDTGLSDAHRYMTQFVGDELLPQAATLIPRIYFEAQWGDEAAYEADAPYLISVSDVSLIRRLARVGTRAAALAKAQLAQRHRPKRTAGPARRTVPLLYTPKDAALGHPITVFRSKSTGGTRRNFFSTPFEVQGPRLYPRNRAGQGVLVDGVMHWSVFALHSLAKETLGNDEPTYPGAREFAQWVDEQDAQMPTDRAFKDALYAANLKQRLIAVSAGERLHLGRFSNAEDAILVEFFTKNQRLKRFDPDAWQSLLVRLPGRTERGILRRYDELGREYAFIHGYAAYERSPFHRRYSALRKKQWRKEGCPP